jgi:N-acyl homoserine lactone hydrolase
MDIDVIVTAELDIPHPYVFRTRGPTLRCPCLAFVLRHPEAGPILVDTGLHPDAWRSLRDDFGLAMSLFFRGLRPAGEPFDAQLRQLGIEPADVRTVVMTHLHVDHTSGLRLLPNAELVCSEREWAAATGGRLPSLQGYVRGHLPDAARVRRVDPTAGPAVEPFGGALDLLGDGSVRLLSTPGHTAGHVSLLVEGAGPAGEPVLLVGDAAYTRRSIDEQRLPLRSVDAGAARRSLARLRAFCEARPEAIVVPTHDPSAWERLAAPAAAPASG